MFHMLTTTEYAPVTDQDTLRRLLTRIAAGEREALAELYHCTRAAVYGLALLYLRNAQDAQDLTQDEERHTALSVEEWDAIPAEERGLDAVERTLLRHALAALGEEERRIVLLHAVAGMKHREIAALLELPLATVLSKYHRALKKMRIILEGDDAR